ncbi:hypothetical protein AAMO2058_000705100 [Amorphochlora amoebiformis]
MRLCGAVTAALLAIGVGLYFAGSRIFEREIPDLTGKVALITGANTGLGFEAAKIMAGKGCTVILACRNGNKCSAAVDSLEHEIPEADVEAMTVDLSDPSSIQSFSLEALESIPRIDYLLNNAGVLIPNPKKTNIKGWELTMAVNHLGHFALVGHLLPLLKASKTRIINHSSVVAHLLAKDPIDFDDLMWEKREYVGRTAYAASKLANLWFTNEINRRLSKYGISANACQPGVVGTTSIFDSFSHAGIQEQNYKLWISEMAFHTFYALLTRTAESAAMPLVIAAISNDTNGLFGPKFMFQGPSVNTGDVLEPGFMYKLFASTNMVYTYNGATSEESGRLWELSADLTGVMKDE